MSPPRSLRFGSAYPNQWARVKLRHLRRELNGEVGDVDALLSRVRLETQQLFDDESRCLPDRQSIAVLSASALALAAYRQIKEELQDDARAQQIVRTATMKTFATPVRLLTRVWLFLTRRPFEFLQKRQVAEMFRRGFGGLMEFEQEVTAHSLDLVVNRCAYHRFFASHGQPQLTTLFCEWDRNWMDVLNRSGRRIWASRPATISTGSQACRFRLSDEEGAGGAATEDVVLVQLRTRGGG